jgi:DNA-binding response OmpR family regulator
MLMHGNTIVLVEDDAVLAKVFKEELEDEKFTVHHAGDGEKGLEMVKSKMPDLVLLDILMPKMNGFQVLEELKKAPETQHIPVMMITALGSDEDIKKGLQLGAGDYVVKSQHAIGEMVEKVKLFLANQKPALKK